MWPIRTILHPTDFSPRSEVAFHLACVLARDHGARLVVLHTVPVPVGVFGEDFAGPPEGAYEGARQKLEEMKAGNPRVAIEHRLAEADPATEVLRAARAEPCDLIIMATHGRTGLSRLLMGSVAEQVVRKAPCPVLTVKPPAWAAKDAPPRRPLTVPEPRRRLAAPLPHGRQGPLPNEGLA
jgi:nucleotide-binding universal stress UspA family protein